MRAVTSNRSQVSYVARKQGGSMPRDTTRDASAELAHRRETQWMTRVHGRSASAAGRRSAAELAVVNLSNDPQILVNASRPFA